MPRSSIALGSWFRTRHSSQYDRPYAEPVRSSGLPETRSLDRLTSGPRRAARTSRPFRRDVLCRTLDGRVALPGTLSNLPFSRSTCRPGDQLGRSLCSSSVGDGVGAPPPSLSTTKIRAGLRRSPRTRCACCRRDHEQIRYVPRQHLHTTADLDSGRRAVNRHDHQLALPSAERRGPGTRRDFRLARTQARSRLAPLVLSSRRSVPSGSAT